MIPQGYRFNIGDRLTYLPTRGGVEVIHRSFELERGNVYRVQSSNGRILGYVKEELLQPKGTPRG